MTVGYYIPKAEAEKPDEHLADAGKKDQKTTEASAQSAAPPTAEKSSSDSAISKDYAPPSNILKTAEANETRNLQPDSAPGGAAPARPRRLRQHRTTKCKQLIEESKIDHRLARQQAQPRL